MTQPRSAGATLDRASPQINFATSLRRPIQLIRLDTGQPCKAHIFGDVAGMSPAYLVVDEQGKQDWVPVAQTQVIESEYVSDSADHLTKKFSAATQKLGKGSY